jgi:hypothetical protein
MKGIIAVLAALFASATLDIGPGAIAAAVAQQVPDVSPPASDISGELRQWHKVTLTIDGPFANELGNAVLRPDEATGELRIPLNASGGTRVASPNPFLDYRMMVRFRHESGEPSFDVPGYFAADGDAATTSATAGRKWRAHLSPDKTGRWDWQVSFVSGPGVAIDAVAAGEPFSPYDGMSGSFQIAASDKQAPDFRTLGRLQYVGAHHLRFAGTGEYFLKAGADAPETLLAYADFDGTATTMSPLDRSWIGPANGHGLHTYASHEGDWRAGDPTWKGSKGKGMIGAINYLASKGMNTISFLTYNAGGDGDNVWPFVSRNDKLHFDVSKLDQWQIVFDHAQRMGLHLHFKLQEQENDDNHLGNPWGAERRTPGVIPEALDGGNTEIERKLYTRELIARFGYALALNWNLGEENTQTTEQQRAWAQYIAEMDPYNHNRVVHTFPGPTHEAVYPHLLGAQSALTGASLQMHYDDVHERTLRWVTASREAGRPWVVANDEQGPAGTGVPPDPGYNGWTGQDAQGNSVQDIHDIRKYVLWGNLMAGGAGVEYYFGYVLPQNDLVAEDFRSRDSSWDYARVALNFFKNEAIPFWEMVNCNERVGNSENDNSRYCFEKPGEMYLIYLPGGGTSQLDLNGVSGTSRLAVRWFDPRNGGALQTGDVTSIRAGGTASLGSPPHSPDEDWLAVIR